MNQQAIQQIVETIKTLNLNINDETTQALVKELVPALQMYLIFDLLKTIICVMGFVIPVILISYLIYKAATQEDKRYLLEAENERAKRKKNEEEQQEKWDKIKK